MTKREFTEADLYEAVTTSPYKNGYRARLRIGERNGKNVYHDVYARSELEVKIKAREFIEKMIAGQDERKAVDSLLSTAFENWLYGEKYGTLKAGSFDRLEQVYRGEILPHISAITLKDCSAADCKKVMDANLARGYSYSTLLKVFRLLREFFRRQHEAGAISYNPMSGIKMYSRDFVRSRQQQAREDKERAITKSSNGQKLAPEELELVLSNLRMEDKEEIRILSEEEIERLRAICENGYYMEWNSRLGNPCKSGPHFLTQSKFFLFMLNTGLRKMEGAALKYSDVNFENKTITIRNNITTSKRRDARGHAIGGITVTQSSPKTKHSATVVPASDMALDILRDMLKEEPEGYDGYIIHGEDGKYLCESAVRRRWNSLLRWANVEHCGLHSLRHTFASRLYETTKNARLVSEMCRHASVSFTSDVYVKLIESGKQMESFRI